MLQLIMNPGKEFIITVESYSYFITEAHEHPNDIAGGNWECIVCDIFVL